jgi:FHA domain/Domain of unknown function (DUF1707)
MRASDRRRDHALASLRESYATGCISTDTLTVRVDAALRARSRWELRRLVADLPRWWDKWRREEPPVVRVGTPPDGPGPWIIGRSTSCRLVLEQDTISGRHAELRRREDGRLEIVDLGSTNGTWVNGWRVDRAVLRDGDVVHRADVRVVI